MSVSFERSGSTRAENTAGSLRTSDARAYVPRAVTVTAAGLVAVLLAQYLAGFLFLWSLRLDPRAASPITVARYAYWYGDRETLRRRLEVCSFLGFVLVLVSGSAIWWPRRRALHGESKFATRRQVLAAGFLDGVGILLGQLAGLWRLGSPYLWLPGQQGVALSAHPRSWKGVSVVVPNLLTWPGSVVCSDIKKENWTLTAGYRQLAGQKTFLFDPLSPDGRTHRWNPLDYVSSAPGQMVSDLQLIANMFFPDPPNSDPFWMSSARALFLGIALYLFATPSLPRTIGEILRQGMADDEEGFGHKWRRVIQGRMSGSKPLSEECVRALYDVIDLAPQTTSSIRKTFTSRLDLWANPVLDAATSASDFDLRKLRIEPMSVYLGIAPKDLHRLQPLLNLFFQQAIALQTDLLPEHHPALKHQVLMVLDEFPALGRIPIMAEASGFLPGYNVRILLIMQTPAQLRQVYGEDGARTLLKTLAARIYFQPKDMDDAEELSRELGFTTVKVTTHSRPVWGLSNGKTGRHGSVTVSEQRRPLMLPQELRSLGKTREIVFTEDTPPILCRKIRYYRVRALRERIRKPPLVPAIELRQSGHSGPLERSAGSVQPMESKETEIFPSASLASRVGATEAVGEGSPRFHEAGIEDLERADTLTLEDFEADFSQVNIPEHEGSLTSEEMKTAVASFLHTLEQ